LTTREPRVYTQVKTSVSSSIYLSGSIEEPAQYIEELQTLREAQETDEVRIFINSGGGRVDTAIQIVNGIRNCKAKVTAVIEGVCHSAATYIFLAADEWEVNLGVLMLIHNYSGGAYGKGADLVDHVIANDTWVKNIMAQCYEGFLTEEELIQVNKNQDIWLESDDILDRLKKLSELREKQYLQHQEELREQALERVKELTQNDTEDSKDVSGSTE
jgi:ATP-dependent Clp protease protease subunit